MSDSEINLPLWLAFLAINEQATRDWLTGLHNRRYFEDTLADHVAAATRYNRELALVLFDLDDFKQINDTQGHDAGDEALRIFATLLKESAREADIVCRYGGDEFAVLLPETGKANTVRFVERVLCGTGILPVKHGQDAQTTHISVTAGIAALPSENLVAAADADLLAKKHADS